MNKKCVNNIFKTTIEKYLGKFIIKLWKGSKL